MVQAPLVFPLFLRDFLLLSFPLQLVSAWFCLQQALYSAHLYFPPIFSASNYMLSILFRRFPHFLRSCSSFCSSLTAPMQFVSTPAFLSAIAPVLGSSFWWVLIWDVSGSYSVCWLCNSCSAGFPEGSISVTCAISRALLILHINRNCVSSWRKTYPCV